MTESEAKIKYDNSPEALRRRCRCIHAEIKTGGMVSPSARCGKDGRYTDPLFCMLCDERREPDAKWQVSSDGYYPYCPICGAQPDKKTRFCAECGAKLGE